ncbi:dihydroxy-acid dehydratase, partial [Alphaproteobacteria bacterium]|nr:dihydroxy-acid dehydratase [Alphaproteobacteria bacterium]
DSQCYLGVLDKVQSIHNVLRSRIGVTGDKLKLRLVQPEFTVATSDGIRNGTKEMRYSLIGREITNDSLCEHLSASGLEGLIAVVACDKPPVGTISAILEHNRPAIIMSDGSIRPGVDSVSGEAIDIISSYQIAGSDDEGLKRRIAMESCPGFGSCGGMFTYNTMQTFLGVLGMEPLHMVAPASQDQRRQDTFPEQLVDYLANLISKNLTPRDIVTRGSIRNAIIVSMSVGGSTNVMLHAPEIARAAGYSDFYKDIMSVEEFNHLSENVVPVIVNARPFGKYSMVDIDSMGGVQVFVKDLLDAGLIDGDLITCTGETLSEQVDRLRPPKPDGTVIYSVKEPFKPTGGLRLLGGNLSPDASAVLKLAGVEGGLDNNIFTGRARVFDGEQSLLEFLDTSPNELSNSDMVVVRYEGPVGGPGMPEMLDSTSRITAICREKNIVVGLMTDGRFSGGSVGLVIGHVGPEAATGGPIGFLENGDTIEVNLDKNELNCKQLDDPHTYKSRKLKWENKLDENSDMHPAVGEADTRLLNRMRCSAVSAVYGAGMHPNGSLWVSNPRKPEVSNFLPKNKFK